MAKLPDSSNCGGPSLVAGRIDLLCVSCSPPISPRSLFTDAFFQRMSTIGGISSPCNVGVWRKQERRKTAVRFSTHRVGRIGENVR